MTLLELKDPLNVLAFLLFAPGEQLQQADLTKMRLPRRTWGLPEFSPVVSAAQAASISVHVRNIPAPAIDLLFRRDMELNGLISDLLGQVCAF